ncbi:MAG: non-lysosomal glucosylceramidase [Fimbriimonadaceae bacterium]|nr:non-lysosomal glucosylceramidase [Fimbriimonadaceae bacterium]
MRGKGLKWIGMPVGGLCAGQVYLGGDGKLWHWDVFSPQMSSDYQFSSRGGHYAEPMEVRSPFEQRFEFVLEGRGGDMPGFDLGTMRTIEFENRYPVGVVRYSDPEVPLRIELEAFSPFIPLQTDDSSQPLSVLRYTLHNPTDKPMRGKVLASLDNRIAGFSGHQDLFKRVNRVRYDGDTVMVECVATPLHPASSTGRPDIAFEDFERATYAPWISTGTAFGDGPFPRSQMPERKSETKAHGEYLVNTHESRHGEESAASDLPTGTLTSPEFTIERGYVNFLIGGGGHKGQTSLDLLIDGKVVRTASGRNSNPMRPASFDVREFAGKRAVLRIVDAVTGGWGHICVDQIVFSDTPWRDDVEWDKLPDYGSMALAILDRPAGTRAWTGPPNVIEPVPATASEEKREEMFERVLLRASRSDPGVLLGVIEAPFAIPPGESQTLEFVLAWHFPNYGPPQGEFGAIEDLPNLKKHYSLRSDSAREAVHAYAREAPRLRGETLKWVDTWFDSTLPHWFLERTLVSVDCLATGTAHRFDNGRFYGWEGVYCCPGTCQHVWNYAQAAARLFPELERDVRERVDFGLAWQPDGTIFYRAESGKQIAHDGQAGTIVRAYREHTMATDGAFLRRVWPKVKGSIERLRREDADGDGVLEGWQYNTLDAAWAGKISWISSVYLAALRAGAAMARDVGEAAYAEELEAVVAKGGASVTEQLFNGEYFAMERDPSHPESIGYGPGCHVDQVLGDSWLHQVGLEPVLPREQVRTALKSLWKYNFAPDAGQYMNAMQAVIKGGRWYAMPGEAGLVMTSFPRGGAQEAKGKGHADWVVGYFNECMNGFEYQAAAHMIAEGLVDEGLAIVRTIHDRYGPEKRNPFNEIECGDHYARSMAAYGVFLTMCGFRYHGPKGEIGFAPKLTPDEFRAPFTAAEGWGTYSQTLRGRRLEATLQVRHGSVGVEALTLERPEGFRAVDAVCTLGGKGCRVSMSTKGASVRLAFGERLNVREASDLHVRLNLEPTGTARSSSAL